MGGGMTERHDSFGIEPPEPAERGRWQIRVVALNQRTEIWDDSMILNDATGYVVCPDEKVARWSYDLMLEKGYARKAE